MPACPASMLGLSGISSFVNYRPCIVAKCCRDVKATVIIGSIWYISNNRQCVCNIASTISALKDANIDGWRRGWLWEGREKRVVVGGEG